MGGSGKDGEGLMNLPKMLVVSAILEIYHPGCLKVPTSWVKQINIADFPAAAMLYLTSDRFVLQPPHVPAPNIDAEGEPVKIQSNARLCVPQAKKRGLIGSRWMCVVQDECVIGTRITETK